MARPPPGIGRLNCPFSCFSDSPMRNDWLIQDTHVVSPELFNCDLGLQEVIVEGDDLPAQRSFLVLMVLGLKEGRERERRN